MNLLSQWLAVALISILFLAAGNNARAAEPWPTTKFKIHVGNAYVGDMTGVGDAIFLYEQENFFGIEDHSRLEFERALHEAAEWYQKKGFPPPALGPLINTDDGLAYQVYVCERNFLESNWDDFLDFVGIYNNSLTRSDFSRCGYDATTESQNAGGYFPKCGSDPTRTQFFEINHERALNDDGTIKEEGYVTITHELFHAIHSNTPAGRTGNCKTQKWIGEGLADAIGHDVAEELWSGRYQEGPTDGHVMKRFGYRVYSEPLYRSDGVSAYPGTGIPINFGYYTSSFWRYLADSYSRGWKFLLTETKNGPTGLLDIPMTGSANWKDQADWVNKGLKGKFNQDLQDMYQLFLTNFSYRIAPFSRYQGSPAEDNLEHWVERLFGTCEVVDLSARQIQSVSLELEPLASTCIWVEPVGKPGLVHISFIASSSDINLLRAISIGQGGTTLITNAAGAAKTMAGPLPNTASWPTFPQDGSKRGLYIVSNVAYLPSNSIKRKLTLSAVLPGNNNSARQTLPLPPKKAAAPLQPSYKKKAKTLNQQKAATAKMVQDQMNLDKKSLNPNVAPSNVISRRPNAPDCSEPFKYQPCGPLTRISLSVMPGTYIAFGQTNTVGGQAGQIMGGFQAMAQTSAFDAQERVQELAAVLDTIDGSDVSISMPMVDYGYTGSFNRAAISVAMAGKRSCSAIGPPDANERTPLTGTVTIEAYTPAVMVGSFVAPLAEFVPGPDGRGVYQSCGTVTGTFTSAAPYLADERSEMIPDSIDQMADDIASSLGVPADMVSRMREDGTLVPQASGGSGSSSGSSSSSGGFMEPDCSCECENQASADELCAFFCEEEYAACGN